MKWCRFKSGDKVSYGIIEGDTVVEVEGSPFEAYSKTSTTYALSSVKLQAPVIPPTFYAAGINYPEHVSWAANKVGTQPNLPKKADVGYRAAKCHNSHRGAHHCAQRRHRGATVRGRTGGGNR